ncbi:YdcH family protein [Bosea thiooxidans]|uniref:YdcH family protein n=1 Tax=Bosea thiooxidans TaxID=53254 RepID=UPI0009A87536|nr:YdcH family protein [Bosea thiooxidans]
MSNTPHTLRDEFPNHLDRIHQLKVKDPEFARILEEYDRVNDQIHRAETKIDAISDESETTLRKMRLSLKDSISKALDKA